MPSSPAPKPPPRRKPATRTVNRAEIVDASFLRLLDEIEQDPHGSLPPVGAPALNAVGLTGEETLRVLEAQLLSRHLDYAARQMRARNEGFYTIGSAGHEANAVLGRLTRPTDPAFLHYRSGAFVMARSQYAADIDPVLDTTLSLAASAHDPISGGRHKVWGSRALWIPPQTSTIASHLPKAVGAAVAMAQAARQRVLPVPDDSIVYCSFGDASANHATALTAFNAAEWTAFQRLPVPILFVCEDNGLGISVRTPHGWIARNFSQRAGLRYLHADGTDLLATWAAAREAVEWCRAQRRPVFLHLTVPRLLAHAGTDAEAEYRPLEEIEADEARDPLLQTARTVLASRLLSVMELRLRYQAVRERVERAARRAAQAPKLDSAPAVMRPLVDSVGADALHAEATRTVDAAARHERFGDTLPEAALPRHLAIQINRALTDLMVKYPQMTLFGEDVAHKGGVYTVTTGLARAFGGHRVFNTLLDETTILGLAQGAAQMGLLPFPEIQYLAYFHNACDQIRGEAASLRFFSNGQFANPMVIRIASLAYQRGFGGHFHNDNSFTALRDIPGLIIACPSRGDDAAAMLRTCAAGALLDGRIIAFLEPIALYMTKDLYEQGDGGWCFPYPAPARAIPLGEPRLYPEPDAARGARPDLLIVTYGNGVPMSLRVARLLAQERGARIRILDLRWLKPLNAPVIAGHARDAGRVLVVDEGRRTGGIAEEIFTLLDERVPGLDKRRVCGEDSYIPLGDAANLVLVSEEAIREAALTLLG